MVRKWCFIVGGRVQIYNCMLGYIFVINFFITSR